MSRLSNRLAGFFAALPAILLMTFMNVLISYTVAATVMLMSMASGLGGSHPKLCLVAAILVAIGVHCWIVFNHKLRAYIKQQEGTIEDE